MHNFLSQLEDMKKEIAEYLADESIPLNERWEKMLTLTISGLVGKNVNTSDFHQLGLQEIDISPYDDFYMEKDSTIRFDSVVEKLIENFNVSDNEIIDVKELMLRKWITHFTYTW